MTSGPTHSRFVSSDARKPLTALVPCSNISCVSTLYHVDVRSQEISHWLFCSATYRGRLSDHHLVALLHPPCSITMSDYILHFSMKEPETLDAAVTALDKINSNSKLLQGLVLYYVKVRRLFRSVAPTFDDWCERISSQYNWDLSMRRAEFYARCGGIVHRLHRRGYTHEGNRCIHVQTINCVSSL